MNVKVRVLRMSYFTTANANPNISVGYREKRNRIRVTPLFRARNLCVGGSLG